MLALSTIPRIIPTIVYALLRYFMCTYSTLTLSRRKGTTTIEHACYYVWSKFMWYCLHTLRHSAFKERYFMYCLRTAYRKHIKYVTYVNPPSCIL